MSFTFTEKQITDYHTHGCTVFRAILPPSLIRDLRRVTERARELARAEKGPQTQRLQPVASYDLDRRPFRDYAELPALRDAIFRVLTPRHDHANLEILGILLEPAERPWCTDWHRDWRDHMPEEVFEAEFREDWDRQTFDVDYMNQVNCALYEDGSTWFVPGSHYRQENTDLEVAAARSVDKGELRRSPDRTDEEQERACLDYCRGMPGATQLRLDAGDFAIYRASAWHLGNYVPYRRRATLHDLVYTPESLAHVRERVPRLKEIMKRREQKVAASR